MYQGGSIRKWALLLVSNRESGVLFATVVELFQLCRWDVTKR